MKEIKETTRVVVEKSIIDQVLDMGQGEVVIAVDDRGKAKEALLRTGLTGWLITGRAFGNRPTALADYHLGQYLDGRRVKEWVEWMQSHGFRLVLVTHEDLA